MWNCKHKSYCQERGRITVVRERISYENVVGDVLDADPSQGEVVYADCSNCYEAAEWIEKED